MPATHTVWYLYLCICARVCTVSVHIFCIFCHFYTYFPLTLQYFFALHCHSEVHISANKILDEMPVITACDTTPQFVKSITYMYRFWRQLSINPELTVCGQKCLMTPYHTTISTLRYTVHLAFIVCKRSSSQ